MPGNQELPPTVQSSTPGVENIAAALLFVRDALLPGVGDPAITQLDQARELVHAVADGTGVTALANVTENLSAARERLRRARDALGTAHTAFASYGAAIGVEAEAGLSVAPIAKGPGAPARSRPERARDAREFQLTYQEKRVGIDNSCATLLSQIPYNHLAAQTRRAMRRGNTMAFFSPVTQFLVDASLNMLRPSAVADRLPLEMEDRAMVAQNCVRDVTAVATKGRVLQRFYDGNAYLSPLVTPQFRYALVHNQDDYINRLGAAPFSDVKIVAGGAAQALQAHGVQGNYADIISNSLDLAIVAGIHKDYAPDMVEFLGKPYGAVHHYVVDTSGERPVVRFSPEAHAFFKSLGRGGCPARQLQSQNAEGHTVFDDGWRGLVNFLMPPGVTFSRQKSLYEA
ncbi:MAG TPA: hypothetical protein VLH86_00810 [Patescibacteria group bacterium]|nr:hypothetical protein [Patescibacteria group bacterium]